MNEPTPRAARFTTVQWLVIVIAAIGFLFDSYELLMTPLVGVPAISELLKLPPNHPSVTEWMGKMLWITATCGGVFGLLGGWLIDRFGRKRIMAVSVFIYALSPFCAAFSTSLEMFVFFRCTTFIGVCVEFVAAITWLAELFQERRQKEIVLGSTQALASLGGIAVTVMAAWINTHANALPALPISDLFNQHGAWRYLLITGLIPALPIALLLPFVPESEIWRQKRAAGTLRRPSFGELFAPALRRTTLVTTALSACAYAAAFGALQITTRSIVPGLPELAQEQKQLDPLQAEATKFNADLDALLPSFQAATDSVPGLETLASKRAKARVAMRAAKNEADRVTTSPEDRTAAQTRLANLGKGFAEFDTELAQLTATNPVAKEKVLAREKLLKALGDNRDKQNGPQNVITARGDMVQMAQETGGLVGRIILAILVVTALARVKLLRVFVVPALLILPVTYLGLYHVSSTVFAAGIFLCGLCVIAQFSYFGEYLPKVFPLHLRGTGGSFATNVGGRMFGTYAAFLTTKIVAPWFSTKPINDRYALAAGLVGGAAMLLALIFSFFLREPTAEKAD